MFQINENSSKKSRRRTAVARGEEGVVGVEEGGEEIDT